MTTCNDMTKAELNVLLPENLRCKNASELKKASKASLINQLERRDATQAEAKALASPTMADEITSMTALQKHVVVALLEAGMDCNGAETVDGMRSDNMCVSDVVDIAKRTSLTMKQVQGVLASSSAWIDTNVEKVNGEKGVDQWLSDWGVQVAFELMAMGVEAKKSKAVDNAIRTAKVTPPKAHKPRVLADRVMIEPGKPEDVKATKAGSKRHLMAEALATGATIEELVELLGWNRDTVSSALRTDMGALGLGVERKAGKYYLLLPKGVRTIPAHDADTNRAAALVAACK